MWMWGRREQRAPEQAARVVLDARFDALAFDLAALWRGTPNCRGEREDYAAWLDRRVAFDREAVRALGHALACKRYVKAGRLTRRATEHYQRFERAAMVKIGALR